MSPLSKAFASLAASVLLSHPTFAQGVLTQKNISLKLAQTIANAALEKCQSMGFKVAVAVVDRGGQTIVMLRDDGAGLHTPEGAERKAYTARTFSQPSAAFVKRLQDRPDTRQNDPDFSELPLRIRVDNGSQFTSRECRPSRDDG
jgi:hypothetical protein